jgi:ribulose-5-phosphate 4-epimerase/fuculose-1-phosphate aldolase
MSCADVAQSTAPAAMLSGLPRAPRRRQTGIAAAGTPSPAGEGAIMDEVQTRHLLVDLAESLFRRGFSVGSAGNISVRLDDGYLITPTNSSFGRLSAANLSRLDESFAHIDGPKPSKEVFMHRAFYRARPQAGAVVHLHSTMATAVSCLPDLPQDNPLPPLTPYFVMRVGRSLPVVAYYRPGDPAMEPAIADAARGARAVLLANHGPVVSAPTLTDAVYAAEELEEAAKLFMTLRHAAPRPLSPAQVEDLLATFG